MEKAKLISILENVKGDYSIVDLRFEKLIDDLKIELRNELAKKSGNFTKILMKNFKSMCKPDIAREKMKRPVLSRINKNDEGYIFTDGLSLYQISNDINIDLSCFDDYIINNENQEWGTYPNTRRLLNGYSEVFDFDFNSHLDEIKIIEKRKTGKGVKKYGEITYNVFKSTYNGVEFGFDAAMLDRAITLMNSYSDSYKCYYAGGYYGGTNPIMFRSNDNKVQVLCLPVRL